MVLSLLDLPVTVMQDIAKFLCPHCRPQQRERDDSASRCRIRCWRLEDQNAALPHLKGLAGLCRVNKVIHALATPYLYHQPPLWVLADPGAMASLHQTITSRRPDLAGCIKSVHLGIDLPRGWTFDMQGGSTPFRYTELPALFAGLCPNLEELCVRRSTDLSLAGGAPGPPLRFPPAGSLPRLRSLDVRPHTDGGLGIDHLVLLLTVAPNLISLCVCRLKEVTAAAAAVTHPDLPVMAGVRELALVDCELKVALLDVVLRRCPGLERLTLRDTACNSEDPQRSDDWRTTPQALADAIVRAAPGLRLLELRVKRGSWPGLHPSDRVLPREGRFRSLKGLGRLEELRIDFDSMLPTLPDHWDEDEDEDEAGAEEGEDWDGEEDDGDDDNNDGCGLSGADAAAELTDLLPPSIRLLHWEGLTLPSVLGLGAFGKCCRVRYPSLKVVFLDYPPAWLRVAMPEGNYLDGVREAMSGTGVELRFRD